MSPKRPKRELLASGRNGDANLQRRAGLVAVEPLSYGSDIWEVRHHGTTPFYPCSVKDNGYNGLVCGKPCYNDA